MLRNAAAPVPARALPRRRPRIGRRKQFSCFFALPPARRLPACEGPLNLRITSIIAPIHLQYAAQTSVTESTFDPFSPEQARVLGVLIEKQVVTPDNYPLTVNSLTAGCNQKSSRHPVMELSEADVQATLEALKRRTLVIESYGASGRVLRYAHNFPKVFEVGSTATMLLAVLMLRGPQTPGELRLNCERMHKFADISSVEAYLDELAARSAGAWWCACPSSPGRGSIAGRSC